ENSPSYSTSGIRSYQPGTPYSSGPYAQFSTYGQADVAHYNTAAPSEPTGPVEEYTTVGDQNLFCSIPNFTGTDKTLPESNEVPIGREALPKISGLPQKNKQKLPSYVPTPKSSVHLVTNGDVPTYRPTPKHVAQRKKSHTIEYDPVKNFAFVEKPVSCDNESSGDEKEATNGRSNGVQTAQNENLEARFSDDDVTVEIDKCKKNWADEDLTDSDEDYNTESTPADLQDKLSALLTPSSQITSKLATLTSEVGSKSVNGKTVPSTECQRNSNKRSSSGKKSSKPQASPDSTSNNIECQPQTSSEHHSSKTQSSKSSSNSKTKILSNSSGKSHSSARSESQKSDKSESTRSDRSKRSLSTDKKISSSSSHKIHSSKDSCNKSRSSEKSNGNSSAGSSSSKTMQSSHKLSSSKTDHVSHKLSSSKTDHVSHKLSSSKTDHVSHKLSSSKTDHVSNKIASSNSEHSSCKLPLSSKSENSSKKSPSSKAEISSHKTPSSKISKGKEDDFKSYPKKIKSEKRDSMNDVPELNLKTERRTSSSSVDQNKKHDVPHINVDSKHLKRHSDVNVKKEHHDRSHVIAKTGQVERRNSKCKLVTERRISDVTTSLFGDESEDSDVQIIEPPPQPVAPVYELSESDHDDDDEAVMSTDDVSLLTDSDSFEECLRIFQESELQRARKSSSVSMPAEQSKNHLVSEHSKEPDHLLSSVGKKRKAHKDADKLRRPKSTTSVSRVKPSPAEVMHNRIVEMQKRALLRAAKREGRESELVNNLVLKSVSSFNNIKRKPQTLSGADSKSTLTSSAEFVMTSTKKREAHTPAPKTPTTSSAGGATMSSAGGATLTPSTFYSKNKNNVKPLETSSAKMVTIASTASKTEKRKAHEPTVTNLKRPLLPAEFGGKVPTNVRQRYLNLMIDEFLKFNPEDTAFTKGQDEEQTVYARASNKNIYLRLAVNAIKRIRMEANESQPSSSKKLCPGVSSLSSMAALPSHAMQSHATTLGGSLAARTSFTLNRSGPAVKHGTFKGAELYERLRRYILTEQQLRDNGFPRPSPDGSNKVIFYKMETKDNFLKDNERTCRRCGKRYFVTKDGSPAMQDKCIYHHGRAFQKKVAGFVDSRYSCCNERQDNKGCQVAECHVNEKNKTDNLTGYMRTLPSGGDKDFKIYSMDCEMVYTKAGLELARVTVVDEDCKTVYETFVKPETEIIDYNTRFSGITAADMVGVSTNLLGVQAVMLSMVSDKTILIGHSLESDLVALKLIHSTVVDTSLVFPHRLGPPYKRALRNLMVELLQKIIQADGKLRSMS
ncbi:unnamed protein product, partial [Lymnaea stagnalis]